MSRIAVDHAHFHPCMDTFLGSLHGVLTALGDAPEMQELWGRSGLGLRMQIHRTLQPVGLFPRKWDETYPRIIRRMGYDAVAGLRDSFYTPNDLRELRMAWMMAIEKALDDGRPAICFGMSGPGFGIINAFDDETEIYDISTFAGGDEHIEAFEIGSLTPPLIFVLIPAGPLPGFDPRAATLEALRDAVDQHLGRERDAKGELLITPPDMVSGPAAYNAWSSALETGQVEPHWGAAVYAAYYTEARSAAALWLSQLALTPDWKYCSELMELAAKHLTQETEGLKLLAQIFPVNEPGALSDPRRRTDAAAMLRAARAEHIAAMENLIEIVHLEAPPGTDPSA